MTAIASSTAPAAVPKAYTAQIKDSFAYESTVKRWPTIITGVIDEISKAIGKEGLSDEAVRQGKSIIEEIGGLKYDVQHDKAITDIPKDGQLNLDLYNGEIVRQGHPSWFHASWLFAECYLYRRLSGIFARRSEWSHYDPFLNQKVNAFKGSSKGVFELAKRIDALVEEERRKKQGSETVKEEAQKLIFFEMFLMCLWGNATDLSLLTNLSVEDMEKLQSVGKGIEEQQKNIISNHLEEVWHHLKGKRGTRIDFVLDNAGFELYTDLILADWLLASGIAAEIVIHCKNQPWFVSDTTPADFEALFNDSLAHPEEFFTPPPSSSEEKQAIAQMRNRWNGYRSSKQLRLSVPATTQIGESTGAADFWTSWCPFPEMVERSPELLQDLAKSALVIFKGDLNYRKLTWDAQWPRTTPFRTAVQQLAGRINLLSLRTCKADVCVDLPEGREAELDKEAPNWPFSGSYGVVSFVPKDGEEA